MTKLAIFLTVIIASLIASAKLLQYSQAEWFGAVDSKFAEKDDKWTRYHCFKDIFEQTIRRLARGDMRLSEAHDRIATATKEINPEYLEFLRIFEEGQTDDERIVRNLVGHVHGLATCDEGFVDDLAEIDRQMEMYLCGAGLNAK